MKSEVDTFLLKGLCLLFIPVGLCVGQQPEGLLPADESAAWTVPGGGTVGSDAIPSAYGLERYQPAWAKNPFMLKTAAVVQAQESFAKDWALAGISSYKGVFTVRLVNKQTGSYERLKEGDDQGEMKIVAVNYHKDRTQSSVEVSKGSETATLTYDDGMLARPVTVNNTQGAPAQPAVPGLPGSAGASSPGAANRADPRVQAQLRAQAAAAQNGVGQGVPPGGNLAPVTDGPLGTTFIPGVGQVPVNNGTGVPGAGPMVVTPGAAVGAGANGPSVTVDPSTGLAVPAGDPTVAPGTTVPQPVTRRRQLIPQPINSK